MRAANPDELNENAFPVMTAKLTERELTEWFPISFQEIGDPWAAPEPAYSVRHRCVGVPGVTVPFARVLWRREDARLPRHVAANTVVASARGAKR
jgi:hypothetical protein